MLVWIKIVRARFFWNFGILMKLSLLSAKNVYCDLFSQQANNKKSNNKRDECGWFWSVQAEPILNFIWRFADFGWFYIHLKILRIVYRLFNYYWKQFLPIYFVWRMIFLSLILLLFGNFFLVVHCWCAIYRIEWKFFHIIRQKWSFNFQFGKYNCCCCFFPVCMLIYSFHSYLNPFDYWLFFSLSRILSTVCIVQQRFCFEWKIKKNQQPKVEYGRKNLYAK